MLAPLLTIVVPVHNGATTLAELAGRVAQALEGNAYELLLVDDASADTSVDVIGSLCADDPRVRGVVLAARAGQHAALLAGLHHARGDVTVTIDDDLQHPPEAIAGLVVRVRRGAELVYAPDVDRWRRPWTFAGALGARLLLARTAGLRVALGSSPFRALRTDLRERFPRELGPHPCLDVHLVAAAKGIEVCPVRHAPSAAHRSRYGLRGRLRLAAAAGAPRPNARPQAARGQTTRGQDVLRRDVSGRAVPHRAALDWSALGESVLGQPSAGQSTTAQSTMAQSTMAQSTLEPSYTIAHMLP
jgi:hypothetical protein